MLKVAYNTIDGHLAIGDGSHADLMRTAAEYDDNVRALVFPDKKAVYFRFFGGPNYDGIGKPTEDQLDTAYRECDKALDQMFRFGIAKKNWKVYHWTTDERRVKAADVRW
jgi:hypothetical protein